MRNKLMVVGVLLSSILGASNYLTPAEYDNIVLSQRSAGYELISNATPTLSANSYQIGGETVNYRCIVVPKIDCRATTPDLIANISEVGVKVGGKTVPVYAANLRVEVDADNWYICGGAFAGVTADESTLTSTTNASGETEITHVYTPNKFIDAYYAFTSHVKTGDADSFMFIKHKQVCR
ncbi:MAG: hypothetical protein IE916_00245 [Epsilonproteobacteria bacterium]|nr:hypothetical protein [Campylobacterota bacterium]